MPRKILPFLLATTLPALLFGPSAQADGPENIKDLLEDPIDLESEESVTRNQHWELALRNVYFYKQREKVDADPTLIDQWGQGVELNYFNGSLSEHLELGASLWGAVKLHGGPDNRGTDIFEKKADGSLSSGYAKVGQLFARLKYNDANFLSLGSGQFDYLTLESSGSRATPSSFVHQALHLGADDWTVYYARTDRWSARHSDEYTRFANNAGNRIDNIQLAGASYDNSRFYLKAEAGESADYLQRTHISGGYRFPIENGDRVDIRLTYLTAQDAGDLYDSTFGERHAGSGLDGKKASISAEYLGDNITFGFMLGRNGDDGFDHYWYQGDHGTMKHWHERQVSEFVAANEKIFHAQFSHAPVQRWQGFEWTMSFTHGSDAKASLDFQSDPNNPVLLGTEWEVDVALSYNFEHQGIPGLSIRFISAYYVNSIDEYDIWNNKNQRSNDNETDNRLYLDYSMAF